MAVSADMVADAIASAIARGDQTIWIPGVLRYVFAILRHLPRTLFRRLPL
ncbi:MAG: hypothetical protein ACRDMX_06960 [Solirubrobacteraceae bacterium]